MVMKPDKIFLMYTYILISNCVVCLAVFWPAFRVLLGVVHLSASQRSNKRQKGQVKGRYVKGQLKITFKVTLITSASFGMMTCTPSSI